VDIEEIKRKVEEGLASIKHHEDLERVRMTLIGRKGIISEAIDRIKTLDKGKRREYGKEINAIKEGVEAKLRELKAFYEDERRRSEEVASKIDITMPGKTPYYRKRDTRLRRP
jgi:phenylalanyl-tRNA synthetase alpha chain